MTIATTNDSASSATTSVSALQYAKPTTVLPDVVDTSVGENYKGSTSDLASTTTLARRSSIIRPLVQVPDRPHNRQFIPLARWEGAVVERFESYFVAEVIDLDSDERAIVEFDLQEISPSDLSLCEPGGLFYWTIGYDVKEGGQRSRASVVRFRRLGAE